MKTLVLPVLISGMVVLLVQGAPAEEDKPAEFHFIRLEYRDLWQRGRPWWMQDWPEADFHFTQGIKRLTRIDIGEPRHVPLTDERIYDYPWIYATQVGFWDLSDAEVAQLREYLQRGGFLVVDDFHGPQDWDVFRTSMERLFPGRPILDLDQGDVIMHLHYNVSEQVKNEVPIPGLRHLRGFRGGTAGVQMQFGPPHWRAIYDERGRMLIAINFNMDVGDAWEHADMPEYPEEMTALAYRFGINYIIYSMTH